MFSMFGPIVWDNESYNQRFNCTHVVTLDRGFQNYPQEINFIFLGHRKKNLLVVGRREL
jgi:hypothetical protein